MIQTRKYEYCEKCPHFEVEQRTTKMNDVIIYVLECKHHAKCESIIEYLKRKFEY